LSQKEKQKKKSENGEGEVQIFLMIVLRFMHFKPRSLQGTSAKSPICIAECWTGSSWMEKGDLNNTFETDSKYGSEERRSPGAFNWNKDL